RLAHLAEDLRLADDHRVEAAGDREQVVDRAFLVVHVQGRRQLVRGDAAVPLQLVRQLGHADVEPGDVGVELDPVAGDEQHRLQHVLGVVQRRGELAVRRARDRALQHVDRRRAVVETHDEERHAPPPVSSMASTASIPMLRWTWNARICSSIDRSTLRTWTPCGVCNTAGAKLRMLRTPALISRSQTSCAACGGVAITPIAMFSAWTISSSLSTCSMVRSATRMPTLPGSRSNSASTLKPRETKPP